MNRAVCFRKTQQIVKTPKKLPSENYANQAVSAACGSSEKAGAAVKMFVRAAK